MSVPYINYKELEEFYTLNEVAKLFRMDKGTLREKCTQYGIKPRRNEIGDWGFVKNDVQKLHYSMYYEDRSNSKKEEDDDPWA